MTSRIGIGLSRASLRTASSSAPPAAGQQRLPWRATPWLLTAVTLLAGCGPAPGQKDIESSPPPAAPAASQAAGLPDLFEDVTQRAGIDFVHQLAGGTLDNIMKSDGAGGAVLDFDRDGYLDLYLVNSGPDPVLGQAPEGTPRWPNRLYRNRGDGTFEDATARAGVGGHGFGTTAAAADYDNDGDTDLLVVNFNSLIVYRNNGDGTFTDVTERAGLLSSQAGISATFADVDNDGRLDVFVANYLRYDPAVRVPPGAPTPYPGPLAYEPELNLLYRNRGDGTFEDISEPAGVRIPGHRAMSVSAYDYDLDGDADFYVSNDGTPNLLLSNDGKGRFTEVGLKSGAGFNQFGGAEGSMGAAIGDCNGDGLPDMFVTRFGTASLYINSPAGFFEDRIQPSGILRAASKFTGWGGNFLDFDNDGDLDLFIANGDAHFLKGMPPLLFENQAKGFFAEAGVRGASDFAKPRNARGSAAWDFDNDGRLDLILTTLGGPPVLLRNVGSTPAHWITLQLEGTRSNRDGFGAHVRLTAGGRTLTAQSRCPTSYIFQQSPRLHFGLGASPAADRIEIRWPSGQTQSLTNVAAGQFLKITEPGASR